jgi:hypothetical protein
MTPKEKAESIYYQFRRLEHDTSWIDNANAKRCARITINEIIKDYEMLTNGLIPSDDLHIFDQMEYWKKVRKELESF